MALRDDPILFKAYCRDRQREFRKKNPNYSKDLLKRRYWADPEKARKQAIDWKDKNVYRYKQLKMVHGAKERAKAQNLPFDLVADDIIIPEYCPIFPWIKLRVERGAGPATAYSPSIDKIIPEKGYVKTNIQVISHRANWIKGNTSIKELKAFAKWIDTLPDPED